MLRRNNDAKEREFQKMPRSATWSSLKAAHDRVFGARPSLPEAGLGVWRAA
jgi:hypothetical protein